MTELETKLLGALKEMTSIVEIHSDATNNNFAWAELDAAHEAIDAAEAAQVSDGWQLVPKEPTPEMLKEIDQHGEYYSDESLKDAYKDMLAAAIRARGNKH